MLEEKTKPCIQGMQEDQQQQLLPTPLLDGAMSLHEHQEGLDAAHHSAYPDSGGMPLAAGAPQEVHMPHPVGPLVTTHQAPAAHQPAQASHGDVPSVAAAAVALVYQQGQVLPKYEPVMTQAERYVPQTVIHQGSDQQEEQTVPIYWANTGYTETQ